MRFFLAGPGLQCIQPFSQLCVWVASSGWLWQDSFWRSWATFRQLQIGNCQTGTDASTLKPLGQNDTHAISCYDILMNFATCFTPVQWNHFVNKEAIVKCIKQQHFNILFFFSQHTVIVMILMIAMPCHASARVANVPLLLPFPSGHGPSVLRHQTFCRETPLGCVVSSRSIASSDVFRWHGGRLCTFLHLWSWWEIFKCILRHETPHICKKPTKYQRLATWCATSRSFFPRRSEIGNLHHRIKKD